jgi:hypothetical protein
MGGRRRAPAAGASRRGAAAIALAALLAAGALELARPAAAQLSGGRAHDKDWKAHESKFLSRKATNDADDPAE